MRRLGSVTAPGIAQATYDAAVAKLVAVSAWVDLTATITTACAGAAASDPDSLAAGLTVTTTTGTFDGATVDCNAFAWTTHASANDGYGETLNYSLGTIASLITGYDPTTHGVQLEVCFVDAGTLNSTRPILAVAIARGGTLGGTAPCVGLGIWASTSVGSYHSVTSSASSSASGQVNPTGQAARAHTRILTIHDSTTKRFILPAIWDSAANPYPACERNTETHSTSDTLVLLIGQSTSTAAAISGLKIRFRVRTIPIANLTLSDLDLGCQA